MWLHQKKLLLGVGGGIAAYKAAILLRALMAEGADVQVVMSKSATLFITPLTFQALSGYPVLSDDSDTLTAWSQNASGQSPRLDGMPHIALTRGADLFLLVPASANRIARLAHGFADDFLAAMALARTCPMMIAPAMNTAMWQHPATQRNVSQVQRDGVMVIAPESGDLACGETGAGRLADTVVVLEHIQRFFTPQCLAGKHLVITAGPTFEPMDPVRGITNLSSGRMGFAIAAAAARAGAQVTLISGPVTLETPFGVKRVPVTTARSMLEATEAVIQGADCFIAVAAVADVRLDQTTDQKIKKQALINHTFRMVTNPDILATIAHAHPEVYCVGFAAETEQLDTYAEHKRKQKGVQLIVGNLVQESMGGDTARVCLYDAMGKHPLPSLPKSTLGQTLISAIAERYYLWSKDKPTLPAQDHLP